MVRYRRQDMSACKRCYNLVMVAVLRPDGQSPIVHPILRRCSSPAPPVSRPACFRFSAPKRSQSRQSHSVTQSVSQSHPRPRRPAPSRRVGHWSGVYVQTARRPQSSRCRSRPFCLRLCPRASAPLRLRCLPLLVFDLHSDAWRSDLGLGACSGPVRVCLRRAQHPNVPIKPSCAYDAL